MSGAKTGYHIGTSGWHYDDWRRRFYPPKLPRPKWLEFYASHFDTVELNNSFYRLPSEAAWANWRDPSPASLAKTLKEIYIYFNNDIGGYAVDNARTIRSYLVEEAG